MAAADADVAVADKGVENVAAPTTAWLRAALFGAGAAVTVWNQAESTGGPPEGHGFFVAPPPAFNRRRSSRGSK
jgi:hypothetical protein